MTRRILLINPNSSETTTEMMVGIARSCAPDDAAITGVTATRSPKMITRAKELAESEAEVVEIGLRAAKDADGIIISAYGDPGLHDLRGQVTIPVTGICEGSMIEASHGGRRFGVATVTPDLAGPIADNARALNLQHLYTGIRLTPGDPLELTKNPEKLNAALADAVRLSFDEDKADAVIIGGGPLGQAAIALAPLFSKPVIAPIPAAMRLLLARMA